jgi:hypothetical protein
LEEETPVPRILRSKEVEVGLRVSAAVETSEYRIQGKSLVVLQVNCRSIYNKALEFWNLVDTYSPDVVIGTESWLRKDIGNAEVFRADFTTFRRDRSARGGGVFICVKNSIACTELWVDDDFEMIAVEVKGMDSKQTWEIIGIYRAPNDDMSAIDKLASRTSLSRNLTKSSIIGGDLNLPDAVWNGDAEKMCGYQASVNSLVWDNGYTQVVRGPTRGEAVLDIYLLRPESSFISCSVVPGISDHNAVLLEVDWKENRQEAQVGRIVPQYHKTDVIGLQAFLRENFKLWAGKGSCVEEVWSSFKDIIFEGIERYVPNKTLRINPDPEYYNREVKRLKVKVRKAYNRSKYRQNHQAELKQLSKELLLAKKKAQEAFLRSVLQNADRCWTEFYKYVKRRRGNRENILAVKDSNGKLVTEPVEKANVLSSYYASIFSSERNNIEIESTDSGTPFTVNIRTIRKRLSAIGKKKSVGPDGIPGEILKLGREAMIPYLARLLDITMNNNALPGDWKKAIVVPIYKGGDRSHVGNYRPVSLTSVVCKQMEHVIAGYLRQVWDTSNWLYEGQHGFRPGYSCESQLATVCQDIADSLDEGVRTDAIVIDFSKAFDLVPHDRLLQKISETGVDVRVVKWIKEFLLGRSQRVRIDGHLSEEASVNSGVPQGSVLGPLLFLAYVNDIWRNIDSNIRLFADDCIIYRRINESNDVEILQTDLNKLKEWALVNKMKINPNKSKSISFTKARVRDRIEYFFGNQLIPETNSIKYLGIIIRSDLNWTDQVNYTVRKAWKALHFVMRILKKGNNNTKHLAYTTLVRPILEYGAVCWDPYREGQIGALNRVQRGAAKFANNADQTSWETLAERRMVSRLCALFKAYTGGMAWKAIGDRLPRPFYLSREDHNLKIRTRKQRTDIGKYSFVNRTISNWNKLPADLLATFPFKLNTFRNRVKKVVRTK